MRCKCLIQAMIFAGAAVIWAAAAVPAASAPKANSANNRKSGDLISQCARLKCRTSVRHFSLQSADGKTVRGETVPFPYVTEQGIILLYPGERIDVSLVRQDDRLAPPAFVAASNPKGSIAPRKLGPATANLSFELQPRGDNKPGMFLMATSQIKAVVKYDLLMYVPIPGGVRAVRTSSCPLRPPQGGQKTFNGIEHWPHPVTMLAIADIRILPPGASTACR